MIRFGPAGGSESFYAEGHRSTLEAPVWLAARGLTAFEYSFGHGVRIGEESARRMGEGFAAESIQLSAHAPYYINLAHDPADRERFERNMAYIVDSAQACDWMGGGRVVIHTGSRRGQEQPEAFRRVLAGLNEALRRLDDRGLSHITLCPETLGKKNQFGNFEEVIALCEAQERLLPTIDFAHLHALGNGALRSPEDFAALLETMRARLGMERVRSFHVHFSRIEYTKKGGERRHRTFAETEYGPEFAHLLPPLVEYGFAPVIICESKGTQAEDAAAMRDMTREYMEALNGNSRVKVDKDSAI